MDASTQNDPVRSYEAARRRLFFALALLTTVTAVGAGGYWYLGQTVGEGMWSLADCIYMTAITITTVGYGEVIDLEKVQFAREWTLLLLTFGISANLYVVSAITSFFVESDFNNVRRFKRDRKRMKEISNHYIVCGVGRTGLNVIEELLAVGESVLAIDERADHLEQLRDRGVLMLHGDATDDEILIKAGIHRAKGIVSALDDDKTNLFVVVSSRQTNPKLRIVTKAVGTSTAAKLRRAGADAVVTPAKIGGMRLASELLRPHVVRFLDEMLRDKEARLRIEEATVGPSGDVVGMALGKADLQHRAGVLVMAVRQPDGDVVHVPPAELVIEPGQTLIAIGTPENIDELRATVGHR
ncbi:MAG: potassium channel family protein [Nannocystales bacterium]